MNRTNNEERIYNTILYEINMCRGIRFLPRQYKAFSMLVHTLIFGFDIRISTHILPTITHISVVTLAIVLTEAECL
jgi:hypothetical protein